MKQVKTIYMKMNNSIQKYNQAISQKYMQQTKTQYVKNEKIKYNNIVKQYKKQSNLMMLQKKT